MADYSELKQNIASVIKSNNRREITGQILQNVLNQMVGSLGENYQLAGFAEPTTNPQQPDQTLFYIAEQAGVYTNFDNITLGDGLSFLMWKNSEWTSHTIGVATHSWVDSNYVSKAFLRQIFRVYDADGFEILPNDTTSIADNIKAMVGLWTNQYLSALGLGDDGQTGAQYLTQLGDVDIDSTTLADGQVLVYDNGLWVNGQAGGVDMSVVWAALAGNTNEQINASHLTTALTGYVTSSSLSTTLADYVTATALNTALASYASQSWVSQNYVSIAFLNRILRAYDSTDTQVQPNDTTTAIDNLKAMVGLWTEQYLSALGQGNDGGGGGYITTLGQLEDVLLTTPSVGQALVYAEVESGVYKWINGTAGVDMSSVWTALAGSTNEQIALSHLTTALSGYVTTGGLSTTLADYVTATALSTTLADYVTATSLSTTLASYATQQWVGQNYVSIAFFNRLFAAYDSSDVIINPNDTTTAVDNIKALVGLWTQQYLSALGQGSDGGGGQGDVTWVLLADDTDTRQIALSHLTTALSGYATQSWVQQQGYITSSALSGYATQTWVGNNYLPLSGGTLTSSNFSPIDINTTYSNEVGLRLYIGNAYKACFGYIYNDGAYIYNAIRNGYLKYTDSGTLTFEGNTVIHSGNVSSYAVTSLAGYATESYVTTQLGNYLPLSGGTITKNSGGTPVLLVENTSNFNWSRGIDVMYPNLGYGSYCNLLIGGKAQSSGNSAYLAYYHANDGGSGNKLVAGFYGNDQNFEMKYGGLFSLKSTSRNILSLYQTSTDSNMGPYINFYLNDGSKGAIGYNNSKGIFIENYVNGTKSLWIEDGGNLTYQNNIILDSGNYTSYLSGYMLKSSDTFSGTHTYTGSSHIFETTGSDTITIFKHTGSGTPIPFKISESSSQTANDENYGVFQIERLNTDNGWNNAGASLYFCLKNTSGVSAEVAGISGVNTQNGKLIFRGRNREEIGSIDSAGLNVSGSINSTYYGIGQNIGGYGTRSILRLNSPSNIPVDIVLRSGTFNTGSYGDWTISSRGNEASNNNFYIFRGEQNSGNASQNSIFRIDSANGYVTIGQNMYSASAAVAQLDVRGNIYATGGVTSLSDERDKEVLGNTTITVEQIAQMPTVLYRWNDGREDMSIHAGTLAQRWEPYLPQVVMKAPDERQTRSFAYGVAALIAATIDARKIVDHEKRLDEQEALIREQGIKISELQNECADLRRENEMLKLKIA